VGDGSNSSLP
jgi:hypothetical protein